jgi:hypothetical protein
MSSIKPLRYFVVTCCIVSRYIEQLTPRYKYSFILLIEVVDVAVENLNKEFDRHGRVHASISDAQRTLQALENTLAITIKLDRLAGTPSILESGNIHSSSPLSHPLPQLVQPTTNDLPNTQLDIDLAS